VIATMDDQVGAALMPQRLGSMLLTAFGGLALVLAGVGIYGVVGYTVARQSREIGIRIAIGSSSAGILRTVVLGMAAPVLAGLVIGVGGAIALGRSVAAFMFQVNPTDPLALAAVAAALLSVALIATLIPARRAARTDPVRVLSAE
jgi:ABC-type antimicrobial peptide transport system permease subunit